MMFMGCTFHRKVLYIVPTTHSLFKLHIVTKSKEAFILMKLYHRNVHMTVIIKMPFLWLASVVLRTRLLLILWTTTTHLLFYCATISCLLNFSMQLFKLNNKKKQIWKCFSTRILSSDIPYLIGRAHVIELV